MDGFLKPWCVLLISILSLSVFSASAAFNIPGIPIVVSPMNSEMDVSVIPTLQTSELQLIDETGGMVSAGILKQSQWLLTKTNEVVLVGGNTLDSSLREQVGGRLFNIASYGLSLSGESAASIFVDSKRLEVLNSVGGLLGYIELPEFIYQADILDEFKAARVRFYQDGIVVQWHYGNASATQPWELKIQATINNDELNFRFDDVNFNADFITAYGTEEVRFSNATTWYGHTLIAIYNTGNKAACRLPSSVSDCSTVYLNTGVVLNDMTFVAERNLASDSNQVAITQALETATQYYWRTRQAIDDGTSGTLYGDWSSFSGFTTVVGQAPVINSDIQVSIDATGDYRGQKANSTFTITNTKGEALINITLNIEKPLHRQITSFPEQCTESEMLIECVINSPDSEEQLEIEYEFTESYSEKSYLYQLCIEEVCGDYQYENYGAVRDLNEFTSYSGELTSIIDLSDLVKPQEIPFVAIIRNTSNEAGQETIFNILTSGRVSTNTEGCSIESEGNRDSINCINSLAIGEELKIQFSLHSTGEAIQVGHFVSLEAPCEFGVCANYANSRLAYKSLLVGVNEEESGSSGGALFFLPALLFLIARRKIIK
jgi:hypothetical protein